MSDVLSVIFDRWDRNPGMHEYGDAIDRRLDRLAGGPGGRDYPPQRQPIRGFPAKLERHETGPIFLLDPSDLPTLSLLLDDIRAMARDWAERSTGAEQKQLSVSIRCGPEASDSGPDEYYAWQRIKVTTEPLTFAEHLDELINLALSLGSGS